MAFPLEALAAIALAIGADANGKLAPVLIFDGSPGEACSFVAIPRGKGVDPNEIKGESPLELAAGPYELRATCGAGEEAIHAAQAVTIKAGKTESPRIELKTTRLRVMARRQGSMLAAAVKLYAPGADLTGAPLSEHAANRKFALAVGRYDLLIQLADPKSPKAEIRLKAVKAQGDEVAVLEADLSDGRVSVGVTDNGKAAEGAIRIFSRDGKDEVGQAAAGQEVQLPPGRYLVQTTLTASADFRARRDDVWIEPGKVTRHVAKFETASFTVSVTKDGKPIDATVRLALPGAADFFNYFSAPGTVLLSSGKYDVTIETEHAGPFKKTVRPNVEVKKAPPTKLAIDFTPGTLTVKVMRAGKKLDPLEVKLFEAGGGTEAAHAELDGRFRIWPGRYELLVRLAEGDEIRDGPFEVKLGEKVQRTIEFTRGTLTVAATRGKSVADEAEVLVFHPGASVPAAKARAASQIPLAPGVYDVKITAGNETEWREGVRVKEGRNTEVSVGFKPRRVEGAMPEGDLAPLSDDLPEGDEPVPSRPKPPPTKP